jgi:hypothetical protein
VDSSRAIDRAIALIFYIGSAVVTAFLTTLFVRDGLGVSSAALRLDALIAAGLLALHSCFRWQCLTARRTSAPSQICISLSGGFEMYCSNTEDRQPLVYCVPCSERTPHRYERLGVNGRQTSRAICLVCNNDSRGDTARQGAAHLSL